MRIQQGPLYMESQLKYKTVPQQEIQPGSTVKVAVHLNQLQDKEKKISI